MSTLKHLVISAVLVLLSLTPVMAQVGTQGSILGAVTDASNAALPGATISVRNLDTGLEQTAVTDEAGNFEILALPIGPYEVTVSMPGFKTWRQERLTLNVGERSRVAPVLEVGQITESVTVEGGAPLLQTERSSVQTVVEMQQIRELPLSTRNPVVLVNLVPGLRFTGAGGPERGSTVQGFGLRENQTEFQLDGLNANAGMDEGGITIPNVDTIAEFSVETSSFSAENGRNPLQIVMATKAGTNAFHGTAWEFVQNDKFNARNAFSTAEPPKLNRNQFGAAAGGPIIRNKTFFFGSFEGTPIRRESLYNSVVVQPEMLEGDFSSLPRAITDPRTGQPFPGNIIPADRISSASRFFFPYLLTPNSPDGRFRAVAPVTDDTYQYTARIDHQITGAQRIYGRWVMNSNENDSPGYSPDVRSANETTQHNIGFNYTNSLTRNMLLTATAGYLRSDNRFTSPVVGTENLVQEAGIQGIGTAGREDFVGLPNVGISGYTGFNTAFGVPGRLWSDVWNAKASLTWLLGGHSLSTGYEFNTRSVYGRHGSHSPRGSFDFNGQYTGDGFADYLLGLTSGTRRNFPLETFGLDRSPYSGAYVQDFWKVRSNLTLGLGLRYEYWHEKTLRAGNGATFDPSIGKVIAGVDENGEVNLTNQPVSPFLAASSQGPVGARHRSGRAGGPVQGQRAPVAARRPHVASRDDQRLRGARRVRHLLQQLHRQPVGVVDRRPAVLDVGSAVVQSADTTGLGDRLADRSGAVHSAVRGRVTGVGHRCHEDIRVERLGAEGPALQLGGHRVVRRLATARSGLAVPVQRSAPGDLPGPSGGQAVSRVRRDQRAGEPRQRQVQRPADQVGAALRGRPLVHRLLLAGEEHLRHRGGGRDRPHPAVHARRVPERARAERPAAHGLDQRGVRAAIWP